MGQPHELTQNSINIDGLALIIVTNHEQQAAINSETTRSGSR
jgi:hypothetical protein